MLEDLKEPS